ncbi:MAG: arginine--tRNA ligase, partial [Gammaproteobacteria bacterium]|nr:arginine--tRNA ligase [Gammaproteobacteria bacterium]
MKTHIADLVHQALAQLADQGVLPADAVQVPVIERTRDASHGDFASNAAMVHSKAARMRPRDLAERLVAALPASDIVSAVEIAGPGFINFRLAGNAYFVQIPEIMRQGHSYGRSNLGAGKRVQVEFVSANPTGPLHV